MVKECCFNCIHSEGCNCEEKVYCLKYHQVKNELDVCSSYKEDN